jgi:hypothetical protein
MFLAAKWAGSGVHAEGLSWTEPIGYLGLQVGSAVVAVWALRFLRSGERAPIDWIELLGIFAGAIWALQVLSPAIFRIIRHSVM